MSFRLLCNLCVLGWRLSPSLTFLPRGEIVTGERPDTAYFAVYVTLGMASAVVMCRLEEGKGFVRFSPTGSNNV